MDRFSVSMMFSFVMRAYALSLNVSLSPANAAEAHMQLCNAERI